MNIVQVTHTVLQLIICFRKRLSDGQCVRGTARDIIVGSIRIKYRKLGLLRVLVVRKIQSRLLMISIVGMQKVSTYLGNICRWLQLDRRRCRVELISIQIQELHEYFAKMMLRLHCTTLYLWHML